MFCDNRQQILCFMFSVISLLGCTNGKFDYLDYRDRLYTCQMGFFVSTTQVNGAIGVAGADAQCQTLAGKVGDCAKRSWRAYLSTSSGNARDRIGSGPWYNVAGQLFAQDIPNLYAITPQQSLFLNELGQDVSADAAWTGSTTSGVVNSLHCSNFTDSSTSPGAIGVAQSVWSAN
jgi:hypothetical protein